MKKKLLTVLLIIALLVTSASCLFACEQTETPKDDPSDIWQDILPEIVGGNGGGKKHSYENGFVSEESYSSPEAAARGMLAEEYSGEAEQLTFVKYEKVKDLSREEIKKLSLGELDAQDVESAEEAKITYSEAVSAAGRRNAQKPLQKTAVILVVEDDYYYYVLEPQENEDLPNSYYKSLFDMSQFDTFLYEGNRRLVLAADGVIMSMTVGTYMVYSRDAAYLEATIYDSVDGEAEIDKVISYILPYNNNRSWGVINANGSWMISQLPYTLEQFAMLTMVTMDQSYFVKTDFGFKIDDAKLMQYQQKLWGDLFEGLLRGAELTVDSSYSNYYVTDDRFDRMESETSMTLTDGIETGHITLTDSVRISEQNSLSASSAAKLDFPQEVFDMVEEQTRPSASVTLDRTSLTLQVYKSDTLTATVYPDDGSQEIVWSSDDESVARVDNGVVTGVSEGTAVITARVGDKSAQCRVTVTNSSVEPSVGEVTADQWKEAFDSGVALTNSTCVGYGENPLTIKVDANVLSITYDGQTRVGIGGPGMSCYMFTEQDGVWVRSSISVEEYNESYQNMRLLITNFLLLNEHYSEFEYQDGKYVCNTAIADTFFTNGGEVTFENGVVVSIIAYQGENRFELTDIGTTEVTIPEEYVEE